MLKSVGSYGKYMFDSYNFNDNGIHSQYWGDPIFITCSSISTKRTLDCTYFLLGTGLRFIKHTLWSNVWRLLHFLEALCHVQASLLFSNCKQKRRWTLWVISNRPSSTLQKCFRIHEDSVEHHYLSLKNRRAALPVNREMDTQAQAGTHLTRGHFAPSCDNCISGSLLFNSWTYCAVKAWQWWCPFLI